MSSGPWRNPSWKIVRFDLPKSGSMTEISDFIRNHGLEAAKKEYAYALLPESRFAPNGLLNGGITVMWNILIGANVVVFSNTNCRLGVSTDNTAFTASQSNLNPSGLATFYMQVIDALFPAVSGQQCSWEATYDGSTANFHWFSFGVDNDAVDGAGSSIASYGATRALFNRFVSDQGTKPMGQTWVLILVIDQT